MSARLLLAALLFALSACAFPMWVDTPIPPPADACGGCAGFCDPATACQPSPVGGSCNLSGLGNACVTGASCVDGRCVAPCSGAACACAGKHCAGRCTNGSCVGAATGEACDPTGEGEPCVSGSCDHGTCTVTGTGDPVALDDYLATARRTFCDYLVRCHRWPAELRGRCDEALFPSADTFDSDTEQVALAKKGALTYDPDAAGACLGAFAELGCGMAYAEACDRMFKGSVAGGGRCTAASACATGLYCGRNDITGLRCEGVCSPRAKAGEDCASVPCLESLSCVDEGADPATPVKRCRETTGAGGAGARCGNGRTPCLGDLYCATDETCQPRRAENADCDSAYGCEDGLVCALVQNRSRAVCLPARATGENCTSDQQCSPLTLQVALNACVNGRCARLPQAGPCVDDPYLANRCDPERASCGDDKHCHPFSDEGGVCVRQADCGGSLTPLVCSFGMCQRPLACE